MYSSRLFVSLQAEIKNLIFNNKSTMKKIISKLMGGVLLFSLSMSLTSCEDVLGHWEKPSPNPITPGGGTPTVDDVIKYGFKVTDLAGDDLTGTVNSLKMSTDDGPIAEAEVSGGKITIKAEKLSGITSAIDFWFEAEIGGKPYIAKVNINPTTLSPESDKTLEMATLGDVILSDGKFAARLSTTGTKVAMIAYLGSETDHATYKHGLALALSDVSANRLSWNNTHANNASKTAAEWCSDWNTTKTITGGTWMLPSKDQWNNMITAAGGYGALRYGFSDITGASDLQSDYYWSSTELGSDLAWSYHFGTGFWLDDNKDDDDRVRACLAF